MSKVSTDSCMLKYRNNSANYLDHPSEQGERIGNIYVGGHLSDYL